MLVPDEPGGRVGAAAAFPSPVVPRIATGVASAALGAGMGLAGGGLAAVSVASALVLTDLVGGGLDQRGVLPGGRLAAAVAASLVLAGYRWRAPLFPRRWG